MKQFLSILKYLAPYWHKALLSVIFNLLAAVFSVISFTMVIPFLGLLFSTQQFVEKLMPLKFSTESIRHNFNFLLGKIVEEKGQVEALIFIIIVVFLSVILKNTFLFLGRLLIIKIRINIVKDLRNNLMDRILNFDLSYFSKERRGDIISKIMIDVKEIEISIISSLEMFLKDPVLIIVYLYVLFFINIKLTLIAFIIFPVSAIIMGRIGKVLRKKSMRGQQKMGALVGILEETLAGIKIVKAFNGERIVKGRFRRLNQYYSNLFERAWKTRVIANPLSDIITAVAILSIMWVGGNMVLHNVTGFNSQVFIGYLAVFTQIIGPSRSVSTGYYNILRGMASVDRINSILKQEYQIKDTPDALDIKNFKSDIEFRNVAFSYENENQRAIKNINLTIKKGESVALIGSSGSGKSTIVDLLPRFFDPDSGEIYIDGIELKKYRIKPLRDLFGYVSQQPVLFHDTIYNNILFANPEASLHDVEFAARRAFAHEFIMEKEQGYKTNLGESGDNLSVGEKQRISIARAILKNPPVLILDEATSALDYKSEFIIHKALENLMKGRTTIIIAHRLSTIKNADKIVVVDQGEIIEHGSHDELLKKNGYYKKMTSLEYL